MNEMIIDRGKECKIWDKIRWYKKCIGIFKNWDFGIKNIIIII